MNSNIELGELKTVPTRWNRSNTDQDANLPLGTLLLIVLDSV